jgi:hypothetical protein
MIHLSRLPANHFKVQEGLFFYTRNVSPYEGGVFHQVRNSPSWLAYSN